MSPLAKALASSVRSGWHAGLDLLFPTECVECRLPGPYICASCAKLCVPAGTGDVKHHRHAFDSLTAAYEMAGPARHAVHALKYRDLRAIAPLMARAMTDAISRTQHEYDLIVPMPLHPSRQRRRGYNQAELLARHIAKQLRKPMDTRILKRALKTPALAKLQSLEERREAIAGAFHCHGSAEGRSILLVDDVITSGSTCGAAADELKDNGAEFVHALSFALEI